MALFFVSFIAGFLTVLAPCTFAFLPVILGGSMNENGKRKLKPLIIVTSLSVSIITFTLLLKATTTLIAIPDIVWKLISGGILLGFGLTLTFPMVWARISLKIPFLFKSNRLLTQGENKKSMWGDIISGAALGPVFSSCSPTYAVIVATVLPQSFSSGFIYLLAYVIGLGLPLLLIGFIGQSLVIKLGWAVDPRGWFKRGLGVVFLLIGVVIMFGLDKKLQTYVLDHGYLNATGTIERGLLKNAR